MAFPPGDFQGNSAGQGNQSTEQDAQENDEQVIIDIDAPERSNNLDLVNAFYGGQNNAVVDEGWLLLIRDAVVGALRELGDFLHTSNQRIGAFTRYLFNAGRVTANAARFLLLGAGAFSVPIIDAPTAESLFGPVRGHGIDGNDGRGWHLHVHRGDITIANNGLLHLTINCPIALSYNLGPLGPNGRDLILVIGGIISPVPSEPSDQQ